LSDILKNIVALVVAVLMSTSLSGQDGRGFRIGIDSSIDCFTVSGDRLSPSIGIGTRARLGSLDRTFNLVGGLRYIYGPRLSGFQVPILLNANLLKGDRSSAYLGAGFEFDFIGSNYGCAKLQVGIAGRRIDFRVFCKPYQGDLGLGFTYYFLGKE